MAMLCAPCRAQQMDGQRVPLVRTVTCKANRTAGKTTARAQSSAKIARLPAFLLQSQRLRRVSLWIPVFISRFV